MLKKIILSCITIFCVTQVNAIEKTQIDLNKTFWGAWGIFNQKTACSESYNFSQPGSFLYKAQQKQLSGEFAVVRYHDPKILDSLILDIKNDNGLTGCGADNNNYQGKQSGFFLKWVSPVSAEICMDEIGKQCTGLYFNKR